MSTPVGLPAPADLPAPVPGDAPPVWLPTPADPAPAGAYAPAGAQPAVITVGGGCAPARVLAAWAALLHHHTGRTDLDFGLRAEAGGHPATVRLRVDPDASLGALAEAAARALRSPVPGQPPSGAPWLVLGAPAAPPGPGPAGALVAELAGAAGEEKMRLRHDPAAHRADAVARHAVHLRAALAALDGDPALPAGRLDPLTPAERTRLLSEFNRTGVPYPRERRVEELFAEQALASPEHPAVVHGDATLSYAELDRRSALLAAGLRARGLPPGAPVALLLRREPAVVVAALAVLRAGGVYLPIDPDYPADRVAYLLADSGARLVLTTRDLAGGLAAGRDLPGGDLTVVTLDDVDWQQDPAGPPPPSGQAPSAGDAAYLMYTSGTTGRPKGVLIPHRGITRLVFGVDYARLDRTTRMAQVGATGFDASVWEMWGALLHGGTLCILDRETLLDTEELGRALREQGITTALFTAALFSRLADEDPGLFRPMRDLLIGGDVLSARHARAVLAAGPGPRLVNAYGPTENTVLSTCHLVAEPVGERVPIGRPLPNTTAYVLNRHGLPLPTGVPGELYVGGDGLALGYHGRPDLTRRAFVPHPFVPGERLYRTGDRARLLPDGAIDFLGRIDHQVKVRGFRVEPGEVEAVLAALPGVRAAVVTSRRLGDSADSHLCGYVAGDPDLDPGRLRRAAAEALPPHMVPASLTVLPALPLTVNGKVDRAALPEPAAVAGTAAAGRPPRDALERTLTGLWEDALGVRDLGVDDPLGSYGASSLTATRLSARIRRALNVACPVSLVLTAPTIAVLAERLRKAEPAGRGALPDARPDGPRDPAPLSPQQHGIYVEQVKDPAGTEYNVPLVVDLPEIPSATRLRAALAALVARHDVLRTDIVLDADGRPRQRVHPEVPVTLEEVDLPAGADLDAWTRRRIRAFDPHRAPLWRAALLCLPDRARLVLDIHHLITDGCSLTLLVTEWAQLLRGGEPAPPGIGYADYARWAAGPAGREHALAQGEFWRRAYATPAPPLDLPTDLRRPAVRRTEGAFLSFPLGADLSHAIRDLARAQGVTPFHVLLAGYTALLGRMSGSTDVTVGTPASGRHLPGVERTQGMFVHTLCLRLNPRPELTFRAYLHAAADHAMAALDHQDFPFEDLMAVAGGGRDYSRHPLFDTLFAVQDTGLHQVDFLGGRPRWTPEATGRTLFDLNLQIHDAPEGFTAHWAYSTSLFMPRTVELFRDDLLALLRAAVAAPGTALHSLNRAAAPMPAVPDFDFDF